MQSVMYRVTVTEDSYAFGFSTDKKLVSLAHLGETLASMVQGKTNPEIQVETVKRQILNYYDVDQKPTQPAILVLAPWGTLPEQDHKINAIKALRDLDPDRLGLKEAKDAIEQGLEIFRPWDLTARVAWILADGLCKYQLFTDVCAREDEANQARSYSPCCHCDGTGRERNGDTCTNCNGTCCSYHYKSVDPSCSSCRIA